MDNLNNIINIIKDFTNKLDKKELISLFDYFTKNTTDLDKIKKCLIVCPNNNTKFLYLRELLEDFNSESINVKLLYTPRQEGLGGTKFKRSEGDQIGNYEGIDLKSSDICYRKQTIEKLVKKINEAGVLLIRSPPMSGKTSLSQLLEQHLVKDINIRVIRISLLWMGIPSEHWTFEEGFQQLMGITWKNFQDECKHIKTILIVDEVQILYVPQGSPINTSYHNGNTFWQTIKRCQQNGRLYIVAFAAYGYKGAWNYSSTTHTMDVSPFKIPSKNTWSIENMCFTKDEYEDYFLRFCKTYLGKIEKVDVKHLQKYISLITARHPGLVVFFMIHIKNHFSQQLKYDKILTFERIFLYLKSSEFINAVDMDFCEYIHIQNLTKEEYELCDNIFRKPIDTELLDSNTFARLVKTSLLSEQDGKLAFASPYLCMLYLQRRFGSTNRAKNPPQDFKSFLQGTFTNMNAKTIQNSYCTGTDGRILERAWQMEFYRAATLVLPPNIFISPDVGAKFGLNGHLDFFVSDMNGSRKWSIELLRDGNNASDHKDRFKQGGIYEPVREISNAWAIIDIRHPGLYNKKPKYEYTDNCHWINVYCQNNWESVIIEDKDEKVEVRLMGEYHD